MVVRFEDLIGKPDDTLNDIASFLNIGRMVRPQQMHDYDKAWLSNSSVGDIDKAFDEKAVNRWKSDHSGLTRSVETLLTKHMKCHGYVPQGKQNALNKVSVKLTFTIYNALNELPLKLKAMIQFLYYGVYKPSINKVFTRRYN